jgi:hypothetical protein
MYVNNNNHYIIAYSKYTVVMTGLYIIIRYFIPFDWLGLVNR